MSNLYHRDIYKFDEPVKSYWEATFNTNNKYNKLEKKFSNKRFEKFLINIWVEMENQI